MIWSPDKPALVEPAAFGILPQAHAPGAVLSIGHVRLAAELPATRVAAEVFVVGSYGGDWLDVVSRTVRTPSAWHVTPLYSLVFTNVGASLGTVQSAAGPTPVTELLRANGLIDSSAIARSIISKEPGTRYAYFRIIDGITVYANKAVSGIVSPTGAVTAIGRRRPLLASSVYPLRSPASAWQLVEAGRWTTMYVDDDTSPDPARIEEFVATTVELAYAELEVIATHELMQPYYVFRDGGGHAVYVPAVIDSLVQLPNSH